MTATLVVTMTYQQYLTGKGLVRTGHGALIPAEQALDWAGLNHRVIGVVLDKLKGITHYSDLQRCFTEQQRLARSPATAAAASPAATPRPASARPTT